MQKVAKALAVGFVSILGAIGLGVASVFAAAFAFGATALVVPGTGTPNANDYPEYLQNARNYYMRDTVCGAPGACLDLGETLTGINYPASFWPITFIPGWCTVNCQKWDVSVAEGVTNLNDAAVAELRDNPEQQVVIYGHSQGAAVVSNTLSLLGDELSPEEKQRLQVVMTGNVDNPAGGMWSRLGFLRYIPIIDLTLGLTTPTDTGIKFTSIAMQYDGAANAPKYWGNLLSLANAVAGFAYLHGTTLIPDERTPPGGVPDYYPTVEEYLAAVYDPANAKTDAYGNTYIVVPSPVLPIVMPFLDIAARTGTTALVKPIVDLVSPVLRVVIDLGYDPDELPGVYSPLSLLPFSPRTNFVDVAEDLVEAVFQGIHDAINGGPTLPIPPFVSLSAAPPSPAPASAMRTSHIDDEPATLEVDTDTVVDVPESPQPDSSGADESGDGDVTEVLDEEDDLTEGDPAEVESADDDAVEGDSAEGEEPEAESTEPTTGEDTDTAPDQDRDDGPDAGSDTDNDSGAGNDAAAA